MAWGKAGSTTKSSASQLLDTTISSNKTNMLLRHIISSGNTAVYYKFNSSTGNEYSFRSSENESNDGETPNTSRVLYDTGGDAGDKFDVTYSVNIATEEKLFIAEQVNSDGSGASTAPIRGQFCGKWNNTTDLASTVNTFCTDQSGNFNTGSNVTVLGSDITPAAAIPALDNVQDGSLFVDKVNANRYWGSNKVTTEEVYAYTTTQSTNEKLSGTAQAYSSERAGVELVSSIFAGKYIKTGKWNLKRVGTLGSNAFMKVEDSSGTVKGTSTGVAASGIGTSAYEDVTFTLPTAVKLANGDRVYVQYTGADGSGNYLAFGEKHPSTTPTGWEFTIYNKRNSSGGSPSGGWGDDGLATALVPVATFDSAPASNVTYDSITWTLQLSLADLKAYWKMGEASGNLIDHATSIGSKTAMKADLVSSGTVNRGRTGHVAGVDCIGFPTYDANGNKVTANNSASDYGFMNKAGAKFTACWWARNYSYNSTVDLWGLGGNGNAADINVRQRGQSGFTIWFSGTEYTGFSTDVSSDGWYFYMLSWDADGGSNNAQLQVNGTKQTATITTTNTSNSNSPLTIGDVSGNEPQMDIQEFSLWNRILTDTEIAHIYNAGVGRQL